MSQDFDIKEFFKKNKRQILISIFLFWLIFAILIIAENEIALRVGNLKADPLDNLQYCIRWVLWTLLTPFVILLAIRFPIRKTNLLVDIVRHFFLALAIITLEFAIEIPIIRFATLKINGTVPPVSDYAAIFILKLNIYLLLYFLVIGTTYLVLYIESNNRSKVISKEVEIKNQQLATQLTEAKLSLLKMQLDPHFLFNTHHAIVSLMLNNENEKAIQMLTQLSDLLRLSLEDQQQTILLERELHLLKLYLGIQQVRFHERLKISFEIEADTLLQKVPAFLLQPLVENAIKHGISISSQATFILIQASILKDELILKVENDGSSIDSGNFRQGIGISNTKERLHQLYGRRSKFELKNLSNERVLALISLPIN